MSTGIPDAAPWSPGAAASAPRGRKGPVTLMVVGGVITVIAVIAFVVSLVAMTRTATSLERVASGQETSLELEDATVYGVYADSDPTCSATGPDGSPVEVSESRASVTVNGHPVQQSLMTGEAGSYALTCTTTTGAPVWFGRLLSVTGIVSGTLVATGAVLAGLLGLALLGGGIIWFFVRRGRDARVRRSWGGPGAPVGR